jgi:NAD+ synthetase
MHKLNYEKVFWTLVEETKKYLLDNNLKAMVLGISGGIDSTVTAAVCHEVSKQTGIPLIGRSLPIKNKYNEFDTSKLVGEAFCDDFQVVELKDLYETSLSMIVYNEQARLAIHKDGNVQTQTLIANGNIQARLRMIYLYNLASIHNGLVMSTDNQTEYQLGFWTIHGDVGDFDPLQDLWKTEVYKLANQILKNYLFQMTSAEEAHMWNVCETYNKMFEAIKKSIELTPTDGLGISNSDLDQIGAKSYAEVDAILQDFLSYNELFSATTKKVNADRYLEYNALYDIEPEVIKKVLDRHITSEFKRKKAPIYIERRKYEI